ncbi:MAG: hypothetical protein VXZ82_13670 [Planctomycetota bacterium]|nr:hypothetical protein [Planctomycetota bacterium]
MFRFFCRVSSRVSAYAVGVLSQLLVVLLVTACSGTEPLQSALPTLHPIVEYQYESDGIKISVPSADEPRVNQFGVASVEAAKRYLRDGALAWVRERGCVNCHTTGPYMTEVPGLNKWLGEPLDEIHANFVSDIPKEIKAINEVERKGHRYYPRSYYTVWRSAGLAEWDKHVTGKLSDATRRSLEDLFERQSANGSFVTYGEVEVPHITTDFELTLQAARAVAAAPGWLESLDDQELLGKVGRMKDYLRKAEPKNDFDRVLLLQLSHYMPELVSVERRQEAINLLWNKQHFDGGWSTRDMSKLDDWHYTISSKVRKLVEGLPDADQPESDAYMTAFAIVLLRQGGVSSTDPRIQQGIAWLKCEQRESGRWWMHSLYRGNYHFTTYLATCQALKALALCEELPY